MADLLGGHIVAMFDNLGGQVAAVKAGRVRALGITTLKRSTQLPEVPTIAESGVPGFEVMVWYGMCAPAAAPEPILAKLNADVLKALATPDLQQRLTEQGIDAAPMTRRDFDAFIRSETLKWAKAVKDSGASVD
jgi:tripartite-type tricarboxylate transporter receptor subunit TctC